MFKKIKRKKLGNGNQQRLLEERYDYYEALRKKSDAIYERFNLDQYINIYNKKMKRKIETHMAKGMLYELVLNTCNQIVYGYNYTYTTEDLYFISHFQMDKHLPELIHLVKEDIKKMQRLQEKEQKQR